MNMHALAMMVFRKQHVSQTVQYSLIAAAFHMNATVREETKCKLDITYTCTIAMENVAFTKTKALCELAERPGVDLGHGYKIFVAVLNS